MGSHLFITTCCPDFSVASGGVHEVKWHIGNKKYCGVQVMLKSLLPPLERTYTLRLGYTSRKCRNYIHLLKTTTFFELLIKLCREMLPTTQLITKQEP